MEVSGIFNMWLDVAIIVIFLINILALHIKVRKLQKESKLKDRRLKHHREMITTLKNFILLYYKSQAPIEGEQIELELGKPKHQTRPPLRETETRAMF